jgi:hypothetical protein
MNYCKCGATFEQYGDWLNHQRLEHAVVDDEWLPTAENINALPEPLRRYVHDLESRCDPAGELRELVLLRDENAMLRGAITALDREDHAAK